MVDLDWCSFIGKFEREKMLVCLHRHLLTHLWELTTDRWMVKQRDRGAASTIEGHTNQQTNKNYLLPTKPKGSTCISHIPKNKGDNILVGLTKKNIISGHYVRNNFDSPHLYTSSGRKVFRLFVLPALPNIQPK